MSTTTETIEKISKSTWFQRFFSEEEKKHEQSILDERDERERPGADERPMPLRELAQVVHRRRRSRRDRLVVQESSNVGAERPGRLVAIGRVPPGRRWEVVGPVARLSSKPGFAD